jgi:WD domain, G-beta repeat
VDRRRRRRATTILSVLLVLAVSAAGIAVIQQRAAQRQQRIATARGLVAQADATRAGDPRIALLLGIAAHHIHPDVETQAGLVNTLTTTHYGTTLPGSDAVLFGQAALAPDGRTVAASVGQRMVVLWDVSDPGRPHRLGQPLTSHSSTIASLAFTPDGRTLATGSAGQTVVLWDLTDRGHPRRLGQPLTGLGGMVASLAFTPDGRVLAAGSTDGTVTLWDLSELNTLRRNPANRACSLTGRGLDRSEWARYLPGLPYQPTCPS